jgi:large conductance mechanosensitive channel
MFKEFKAFIMRGNVVDLAVGVIIGVAFKAVVDALVDGVFTPLIGAISGGQDFSSLTIDLKDDAVIHYGLFINAVISFVLISAVVFFVVVKPLNVLNERRKRGDVPAEETPAPSDEALILAEIRDLLKAQRAG